MKIKIKESLEITIIFIILLIAAPARASNMVPAKNDFNGNPEWFASWTKKG